MKKYSILSRAPDAPDAVEWSIQNIGDSKPVSAGRSFFTRFELPALHSFILLERFPYSKVNDTAYSTIYTQLGRGEKWMYAILKGNNRKWSVYSFI